MNDELEFLISQYADGTLGDAEARAVEARLVADIEARAELEKHRRLIAALRGMPTPAVQWDLLSERIESAVANATEPAEANTGPTSYKLFSHRFAWAAMGLAASLLIAAGVTIRMLGAGHGRLSPAHSAPLAVVPFTRVMGPRAQIATGPAMTQVSIGPGKSLTAGGASAYGEQASRPASVLVASGAVAADDTTPQLPF